MTCSNISNLSQSSCVTIFVKIHPDSMFKLIHDTVDVGLRYTWQILKALVCTIFMRESSATEEMGKVSLCNKTHILKGEKSYKVYENKTFSRAVAIRLCAIDEKVYLCRLYLYSLKAKFDGKSIFSLVNTNQKITLKSERSLHIRFRGISLCFTCTYYLPRSPLNFYSILFIPEYFLEK